MEINQIKENIKNKKSDWELLKVLDTDLKSTSKIRVRHNCGYIIEKTYSNFMRNTFECKVCSEKRKEIERKNEFQKRLNEKFNEQYEVINFTKVKENTTIKCLKCNHEFVIKGSNILTPTFGGCPNCRSKNIISLEEIKRRIKEKHGNKFVYISGYKDTLEDICEFKFVKCKHTFKMNLKNLLRRKNINCEKCNEKDLKKIERIDKTIEPLYKALKIEADKKRVLVRCNKCGKELYLPINNLFTFKRCSCEDSLRQIISENFIELFKFGKSLNLSSYLKNNMEAVTDFNYYRVTDYYFSKKINDKLINLTNDINMTLKDKNLNNLVKLPHKKIHMTFNNLKLKNDDNIITIKECYAIQLDNFNIDKIFHLSFDFETKKNLEMTFGFRNGYLFTGKVTADKRIRLALTFIFKLILILNREEDFREIQEYESNNKINNILYKNDRESSITTKVELRNIIFNLTKNKLKIINRGHTNRKIGCNFTVAAHYRYYEKTGKRVFINSFEKGKEFKNIRRIEKNYIVK